jgi:hypothetical protein
MDTRLAKLFLEDGGHVLVEVFEMEGDIERVGVAEKAGKTFEAAWDTILPVIQSLAKKVASCGPAETRIKFGVKLSSDLNAFIASANAEANFEVTVSWKP